MEDESPQIAALTSVQERLAEEKEQRALERFVWALVCIILLDVIVLGPIKNVAVPIVVLILELIALSVVAQNMGVRPAAVILDKVTSAIVKKEAGTDS